MWVIQSGLLVQLPDNAPLPRSSVRVDVPEGFLSEPRSYRVEDDRVVRRPEEEIRKLQKRKSSKLTSKDIARIKKAIADGRL